jgi:hypothetical protein
MNNLPPVLITAFLRKEKTLALISHLTDLGVQSIYVSLDKGRNDSELGIQQELIHEIASINRNSGSRIFLNRAKNSNGLAVSIISGLDWFFSHESFGIILEDDVWPSPDFFTYCLENEQFLVSDECLWIISGNRFGITSNRENHPVLSRYPLIWGWATSAHKWESIRSEILYRHDFDFRTVMNPMKLGFFLTGLIRSRYGLIDSWAVPLSARMYFRRAACLIPPVNLVTNLGDDRHATHSLSTDPIINNPIEDSSGCELLYQPSESDFSADLTIERDVYNIRLLNLFSPLRLIFLSWRFLRRKPQHLSDKLEFLVPIEE